MERPVIATGTKGEGPLAIYCAGGSLPFAVASAARRQGREVFIYAIRGWADAEKVAAYPHRWGGLGRFGQFCRFAREHNCTDVVFIGSLARPAFWRVWPDLKTLLLAPKIFTGFRGGDNHLLSTVSRIVEQHGFRILGAHEVAPEILASEGVLGSIAPSASDHADIARGLEFLRATGPFDVGQAVVVADNRVLAVEAADGTDRMLEHVAALRYEGRIRIPARRGVLVKAPKIAQDLRLDMPSIGPLTIERAATAGLGGVAVAANATVMAEPQRVAEAADRAKLFVVGVPVEGAHG